MLQDRISQFLTKEIETQKKQKNNSRATIELYPEELSFIEKHQLISDDLKGSIILVEKNNDLRFENAYIERCDKETEQSISQETAAFLKQPIGFLKKYKKEFIYIESAWLDLVRSDAISIEVDDVFGTYDVMLGLKLQKKYQSSLREQLNSRLSGEEPKFDLMFNNDDGLWDVNFTLNYVDGFSEDLTIGEACQLIYHLLFTIVEQVERHL